MSLTFSLELALEWDKNLFEKAKHLLANMNTREQSTVEGHFDRIYLQGKVHACRRLQLQ